MKGISSVMINIVAALLLVAAPCFASDQTASPAGEKTQKTGEKTAEDVMNITLKIPPTSTRLSDCPITVGKGEEMKIPLGSPQFSDCPIAEVNDDAITVEDLTELLVSSHEQRQESTAGKIKISFSEPLRRLINVKLIIQEARNIGLDELPEVKSAMDTFADAILTQLFIQDLVKDVTVDDKEIEPVYREMIREWKMKSIMFDKEKDAKKAKEALRAGKTFEEITSKALKDKTAYGNEEAAYVKPDSLDPAIRKVISKMKVGSVSPVIPVGSAKHDYSLVKLEEELFRENPGKKEEARTGVLASKKNQLLRKTQEELAGKYVTLDKKLNKSLDYDSKKPGMDALLKDDRVLVKIAGEDPILVKDLSRAVNDKFFHGIETAQKNKEVNKVKEDVLDDMIGRRVVWKEALLRGFDKTKRYKKIVADKEENILFGTFVKKVIVPNIKIGDEDIKAYYNKHVDEYTYPEMIKLKGLAFDKLPDAEAALDKLKKGADYTWVKDNAVGQTNADAEDVQIFDENMLMVTKLPDGIQKALTGVRPEEFRTAAGPDGRYYLLSVLEVVPARKQPIEEASVAIAQNVFNAKIESSLEEWAGKLRHEARVDVYLKQ